MKSFAELFKKYRLRAEFETIASFSDALGEKGFYYEDSIFSHWQKGTRIPTGRLLMLAIIQIFVENGALNSIQEANELLAAAKMGYLTEVEKESLRLKEDHNSPFQVPTEIVHFIGRENIIEEIEKEIHLNKKVLIYGPPGIGKTAIAIKLGHQLRDQFPDGVLWYKVDSSNVMDILLSIAALLGENISNIKSAQVRASIVRTLLGDKKILLIFDNVSTHDNISLLLPNTTNCSVILTSQENFRTMASHYRIIKIPPFTEKELLNLFKNIFGSKYVEKYKKIILKVGDKLGNLPLATHISAHIIATYTKQYSQSIDTYLQHFDIESLDLKSFHYEDKNFYTAATLAFNTLDEQSMNIFISLGVFDGKDFSLEAVAFINNLLLKQVEQSALKLKRISFIQQVNDVRYSIHPLLKVFAMQKMKDATYYLRAANYYEKLLGNYQKKATQFYPEIRLETDNIIYIFKKCYEFQYWDPITNLWNPLERLLQNTKELDKLRPLAESVSQAKKTNIFQKILFVYVFLHIMFWVILHISLLKYGFWNNVFNISLTMIPLVGGVNGLIIAKSWGFFKNSLGKALACLSIGLICWAVGNLIVTCYDLFLKTYHPYPTWGDLFFFISFYIWAIGIFLLSHAAGTKYSSFQKHGKKFLIIGSSVVLLLSTFLIGVFIRDYGLLEPSFFSPKVLLNIGYAFGLIVMLALALVIFSLSFGFFGGRYKISMYSLLIGFILIYVAVAIYYPLIATQSYYNGNWGDFVYSIALAFISFGVLGFYKPNKEMVSS